MARIGLLGGSFNPAHRGHRHVSLEVMRRIGLDEVWWLVSPQNPLKAKGGMAPLAVRLESARQMARHPRIRPTAIEAELGTQFAVDTVAALKARFPQHRFAWIMGADNLLQFSRWKRWRDIARQVPIVVAARPNYIRGARLAPAMAWFRRHRPQGSERETLERMGAAGDCDPQDPARSHVRHGDPRARPGMGRPDRHSKPEGIRIVLQYRRGEGPRPRA